jgi:phosphatidylglycerophosphatase A
MPGTLASLITFIAGYFIYPYLTLTSALIFLMMVTILAYFSISQILKYLNNKDPSWIVIDEVVASGLILALIPRVINGYIIAFIIFRLFDGQKIWPINLLDKIKTPLGVLIDDLAAGIIAIAIVWLIFLF